MPRAVAVEEQMITAPSGNTLGETDVGPVSTAAHHAPQQDSIPRRIGRYPILGALGEGGMGVVYAAYDEELDRRIAIKLLRNKEGPRKEENRVRIRREAQAMARLSDPGVAHVYEVGEFEGLTYIAMEYVRGKTLKAWLTEDHPLDKRIEILVQAGRGLVAAHRAGVVHRDFKPDNVMVDREARARVLDFGLAQAHDEPPSDPTQAAAESFTSGRLDAQSPEITRVGTVMGTPAYMSPEQHMGAPTNAATDQYSFSAVAYWGLYGVRPYEGRNRLAICHAIMQGDMTPPPAGHAVPAAVHLVIMRGLSKEESARWPSMADLVDALETAAGSKKRSWLAPVLGLLAMAVIALLGVLLLLQPEPTEGQSRVDQLARSAILAGAHARWVYPEPGAPEDTALLWVHKVDALAEDDDEPGDIVDSAISEAKTLRKDFGATLSRLGDYYWDRDGGRTFARDFYLQAALFDGTATVPRERSGFTNGELAEIRARALAGELTPVEIEAGEDLAALAAVALTEPDEAAPEETVVAEALATIIDRREATRGSGRAPSKRTPAPDKPEPEPEPTPEPDPEGLLDPDVLLDPDALADPEPAPDLSGLAPAASPVDRSQAKKQAAALVAEAERLRRAGRASAAQNKFYAALRLHSRNAKAHDGLRRIKFDAGRYAEAVPHAEKAVRDAPGRSRYRRTLGDAYFKVGRLTDAEAAYTQAVAMGDTKAKERLARVRKKLGR